MIIGLVVVVVVALGVADIIAFGRLIDDVPDGKALDWLDSADARIARLPCGAIYVRWIRRK